MSSKTKRPERSAWLARPRGHEDARTWYTVAMKRRLISGMAVLILAGVAYTVASGRLPRTAIAHPKSVQPLPLQPAQPSPNGWHTYTDNARGFEFDYPSHGWSLTIGTDTLPYAPALRYPTESGSIDLYTQRTPPEGVSISVTVYKIDPQSSLMPWIISGIPISTLPDTGTVQRLFTKGDDINTALKSAYSGQRGLLTLRAMSVGNAPYEMGAVLFPGMLTYATFFARADGNVYAVSLRFPFNGPAHPYDDADSIYVDTYKHVTSTFRFLR